MKKKYKFPPVELSDIWAALFPADFHQKYRYLGAVPWNEGGDIHEAMEPLVIFMDYKARPWWCPRFVLRLLHLFGDDNSVVRCRNWHLSQLKRRLTKGIGIWDYKTKWSNYDLRISISGDRQIYDLSDAIESHFYKQGYREDLAERIKELDPETKFNKRSNIESLKEELERLDNEES
jgi:hypothetical protein